MQRDPTDQPLGTRSVSLSWSYWENPQWANPASSSALSRDNSMSTRRAQLEVRGHKGAGVASRRPKKDLGIEEKGATCPERLNTPGAGEPLLIWVLELNPAAGLHAKVPGINWESDKAGFLSRFCLLIICVTLAKTLPLTEPLGRERLGQDVCGSFLLCQAVHLPWPPTFQNGEMA